MRILSTLLMLVAAATLTASADNVTEQQALTIAQQFVNRTPHAEGDWQSPTPRTLKGNLQSPTLRMVKKAVNAMGEADYYVFNKTDGQGFIVVSGDDRATPVWAYSDTDSFTADDMPENVSWWLGEYQRQLQFLREHPEAARTTKKLASSVSPLMTTTWKQGEPYNQEIPSIRFSLGTKKPVVGCVALAMAQMMKAHNWPTTGEGSHSYSWQPDGAQKATTFAADFGATTYQWASMKDSYSSSQDATAVATLCYHAGVSVDMQYNTADNGGSGAQIYDAMKALRNYFRYDKGLDLYLRDFYQLDTWEQMLRDDLDQGNPIIYGGSTANMYGHCFVFDGYDTDGRFHINWGWGGDYNGYFVSSVLDSGRANADFSHWQQAILGAKPDYDGTSTGAALRPLTGYLIDLGTQQTQVHVGNSVGLVIEGITFLGEGSYETNYCGVRVYTEDEQTVVKDEWQADCSTMRIGESYAIDETAALEIPADIAEGTYHIYAVYALDDVDAKNPIRYQRPPEKSQYIKMEVKNGVAYFSEGETNPDPGPGPEPVTTPTLSVNPNTLSFEAEEGQTTTLTFTVGGQNIEAVTTLTLTGDDVFSISQNSIEATQLADGQASVTVTFAPATAGTYNATITIASEGASSKVVTLTGEATAKTQPGDDPQPGNDPAATAYLDIANHANIGEAGTVPDGMSAIWQYNEYPEQQVGCLTLAAWGAWQDDDAQDWIAVDATYSYTTRWEANPEGYMLGHEAYFTSGSKVIDGESTETFYVSNCSQAIAYGHNYSSLSNITMEVFECTESENGLVASTTPFDVQEGTPRAQFLLASALLDCNKIYKVVLTNTNSEVYEFAFLTPLKGDTPQTPTGIASYNSTPGSQHPTSIYDLQGRLMQNLRSTSGKPNPLPQRKGIYIINGKKVVAR